MNKRTLWQTIQREALEEGRLTPRLALHLEDVVLKHANLAEALSHLLIRHLCKVDETLTSFAPEFQEFISAYALDDAAGADLWKLASVSPTCPNILAAFLSFHGFQAFQLHRLAHCYWNKNKRTFAVLLQNWGALIYGVDIHPAAKIGCGLFVDHAIGIVIGETAVIEDEVSIWHGVTLGSTFAETGDRHPKIRRGATLAAGATILGNIEIGKGAVIAAGSVVLKDVPAGMVAAGVPAKIIKSAADSYAAITEPKQTLKGKK